MSWEPEPLTAGDASIYNDASGNPADQKLGRRHGKKGGIMLCFDGHVEFLRLQIYDEELVNAQKNRLWNNPGTTNGR